MQICDSFAKISAKFCGFFAKVIPMKSSQFPCYRVKSSNLKMLLLSFSRVLEAWNGVCKKNEKSAH